MYGLKCGFYSGDLTRLVTKDIPALKPTFFASVPRLYNGIYSKIKDKISKLEGFKAKLVNYAIAKKLRKLEETGDVKNWLLDKLVFAKMSEALGGRVRVMLTASAPISSEVMNFLRIAFSSEMI
jgi:long-chain acyl-CoA synthetase